MSNETISVRPRGTMPAMQWNGTHLSYEAINAWATGDRAGAELTCDTYDPGKGEQPTGVMVRTPTGWKSLAVGGWVIEYMHTHGRHNGFAALSHEEFVAAYVEVADE